ncbi:MAG: DUF983 domain-containing protein [Hyphomicrobiales bacterium]|nr:DUF983 domain-containing protein [Hyphomicrobiales bacterium]
MTDSGQPPPASRQDRRSPWLAIGRGLRTRCPACALGRLYKSYLKTDEICRNCGEELFHHRADDAPPWFTMLIVGHVLVALVLWTEIALSPPLWLHMLIWLPLTLVLSLLLLPMIKGAVLGLQWACRMHGFGKAGHGDE